MKRPKWKGFFAKPENYRDKNLKEAETMSRSSSIIPKFIDKTFKIHNGKTFKDLTVTKDMLGHKFGEFCKTRVEFEFKKKKKKKKK